MVFNIKWRKKYVFAHIAPQNKLKDFYIELFPKYGNRNQTDP